MTAPPAQHAARAAAERHGRRAEWIASLYCLARGFQIVERRFKAGGGEIDLILRRGGLVVFAEVKARGALDDAVFAVTPRARRRIVAAARQWTASRPQFAAFAMRYDIIAVAGWRLRHVSAAWREDDV